jgi:hypothetical protein
MQAWSEQPSDGEFYFPISHGGLVGLALSFSALIGGFLWSSKNNRPGFTNCTVSTCTNQTLKLSFESLLYKMKKY